MLIPAAEQIEMAIDQISEANAAGKDLSVGLQDEAKELKEALGDGATPDLVKGYQLGLQTARIILALDPKAQAVEGGSGSLL